MALTAQQSKVARLIYQTGLSAGLDPARARELVAASYAESGLNPSARNKSSGAAGLFQLLSSGYVNTANKLGGVYNPVANVKAILPQYVRYWQQHPNAAPGAAGRDVEISGQGAGFYAHPLSVIGQFPAGQPISSQPARVAPAGAPAFDQRQAILSSLAAGKQINFLSLLRNQQTAQAAAPTQPVQRPSGRFAVQDRGKLIGFPYQGTHTLYNNWESDNAVDISLPKGTPVYAPADGVIGGQIGPLGSGDPRLQGNRLHLVSKGNEFYLAHLSRLAVQAGQQVHAGQLLGYSGVANGVAHLHIATRKGSPQKILGV